MRQLDQETPEDVYEDLIAVCSKILHDAELGRVWVEDISTLRDNCNSVKAIIAHDGYKVFPKISKEPT